MYSGFYPLYYPVLSLQVTNYIFYLPVKENVAPPEPDSTSTTCLTPYPMATGISSVPEVRVNTNVSAEVECDSTYYTPEEEEAAEEAGNMDDWVTEFDP